MSMHTHAINDFITNEEAASYVILAKENGFVVDKEAAAYIILAKENTNRNNIKKIINNDRFNEQAKAGTLPDRYYDLDSIQKILDSQGCHYCKKFKGTATTMFPERIENPTDIEYNGNTLLYIPCCRTPDYFRPVYDSPEEMLDEIKERFHSVNVEFPKSFNWWGHMMEINGTYLDH